MRSSLPKGHFIGSLLPTFLVACSVWAFSEPLRAEVSKPRVFDCSTGLTKKELSTRSRNYSRSAQVEAVEKVFRSLPKKDSAEWNLMVQKMAAAMNPKTGVGYALTDLRKYLPEKVFDNLYDSFAIPHQFNLLADDQEPQAGRVLFDHWPDEWGLQSIKFDRKIVTAFKSLNSWIEELIEAALPDEDARANLTDIRVSTENGGTSANYWHPDGNYITSTLLLVGDSGTWARPKGSSQILKVPRGVLLTISGESRRARYRSVIPTVHTSPPDSSSTRRMIVISRVGNE